MTDHKSSYSLPGVSTTLHILAASVVFCASGNICQEGLLTAGVGGGVKALAYAVFTLGSF